MPAAEVVLPEAVHDHAGEQVPGPVSVSVSQLANAVRW